MDDNLYFMETFSNYTNLLFQIWLEKTTRIVNVISHTDLYIKDALTLFSGPLRLSYKTY
jgi:hypothetical protein